MELDKTMVNFPTFFYDIHTMEEVQFLAECRVPSAEYRVPSAECRVPSAECWVLSAATYSWCSLVPAILHSIFWWYETLSGLPPALQAQTRVYMKQRKRQNYWCGSPRLLYSTRFQYIFWWCEKVILRWNNNIKKLGTVTVPLHVCVSRASPKFQSFNLG